jgi:transposase-like protein
MPDQEAEAWREELIRQMYRRVLSVRDVAKAAGISKDTVSRARASGEHLTFEMRLRITKAVESFPPNPEADAQLEARFADSTAQEDS